VTDTLSCDRAAELLSDHYEGTLEGILARELDAHLARCAECASLRDALGDVIDLLRAAPVMEPAPDLAERAATAALAAARARRRFDFPALVRRPPAWLAASLRGVPVPVQAIAATLAIALSAGFILIGASAKRIVPADRAPLVDRVATATVLLAEKKDRLVEDFRFLRVIVATAFEGRMDRVNDRVEDYRRLLERRRQDGQGKDHKKSEARLSGRHLAANIRTRSEPVS
jgi:putative zinc finger protein